MVSSTTPSPDPKWPPVTPTTEIPGQVLAAEATAPSSSNGGGNVFAQAAGKDMTRQSFVQTLESGKRFQTGVYPPVQYSPNNHFGGTQSHLLRADCQARQYKTEAQFVSGF